MHDMLQSGIRGGVSVISHRYAKANNTHISEYDPKMSISSLLYMDANNLYGYCMSQDLPYNEFEWHKDCSWSSLEKTFDDSNGYGYILEVDLEYPEILHDYHNDFPLAPENIIIPEAFLSDYHKSDDEVYMPTQKLGGTFLKKEKYVCHYKTLMYYVSKGLIVKNVHRVLKFKERNWMGEYILKNNQLRTHASTEFEKDFYKLMNNVVFGKTIENVWKYVNVKLVDNEEKARKLTCKPWATYGTHKIFSDNLVAVHMPNKIVRLNKPIYLGFAILELAKLHMFQMHYDVMRNQFGERAKLLFTDTDSLCYQIRTENICSELQTISDHLDTSNYPESHPL